jgi:uncharacterized OB-fold protein
MKAEEVEIFEAPYYYRADYLYSYGELSRFFKEVVESKRLLATRCPNCNKVWMPPRGYCSDCYGKTEWIPLIGKGTVMSCSYCYQTPSGEVPKYLDLPYVLALIKLDGADTCMMHGVATNEPTMGSIKTGTRVKVVFKEERRGTLADFYFVPEDDY